MLEMLEVLEVEETELEREDVADPERREQGLDGEESAKV
jgi:hypothetical protein